MISSQPKALSTLFLGEFLEKFSFWGLQSLLVLYLTKSLNITGYKAYTIFGTFTALTFSLSILAGILADKVFGFRNAVIFGTLFIIAGNFFLGLSDINWTYTGLAIIAIGSALFTTNNSNLLGTFYEKVDSRRSKGFVIFYVATNMGGLLGPVIYGIISLSFDWHNCFKLSAIALSLWLFLLLFFNKDLISKGLPPNSIKEKISIQLFNLFSFFLLLIITSCILFFMKYVQYTAILIIFLGISGLLTLMLSVSRTLPSERNAIIILLAMILFCSVFFAIEFQVNSSLLLFTEQHVDRNFLNWTFPTNIFAALEPFFVIILSPVFAFTWKILDTKEEYSSFFKITLGLLLEGAGFLIFSLGSDLVTMHVQKISILWLIAGNLLLGAGEICVMPTVIASITKTAPYKLKGSIMGMLYLSLAFSGYMSGIIASLTTKSLHHDIFIASEYTHVYNKIAEGAFLAAGIATLSYFLTKYKPIFIKKS